MADYTLSAKITGDAKSFQTCLSNAENAVTNFEKKIGGISAKFQSVGDRISKIGSKLTSTITKPAVAATSALTGVTLVKGFNRLTGIDDAKAKLKALGNTAKDTEEIMDSALASVKGTSFGMDEAATTAAGAVAAGVKLGQDLTKYLTMTADAAAIAGSSMADMGSIMNKVQTSQVAYTDNLNQLADRGIPIYQWIAKEAGKSSSAVKDMASEGEISSELFFKAIQKNIGGAAKSMGEDSFKSTLANIGASISRIGANFLDAGGQGGGFFSTVKPMLADFNTKLGAVEEKAKEWGVIFGQAFTGIVQYIKTGKTQMSGFSAQAQTIVSKIEPMVDAVKSLGNVLDKMKSKGIPIEKLAAGALALGPAMTIAGKATSTFGGAFSGISKVVGLFGSAVSGTNGMVSSFIGRFSSLAGSVNKAKAPIKALGSSLGGVLGKFKSLGSGVLGKVGDGFAFLGAKIPKVSLPFVVLKTRLQEISGTVGGKFSSVFGKIGGIFSSVTGKLGKFFGPIGDLASKMGSAFSGVLGVAKNFGGQFTSILMKAFGFGAIGGLVLVGLGLIQKNFGDKIGEILTMVQEKAPGIITNLCNGITSQLPTLIAKGGELISSLLTTLVTLAPSLISGGANIVVSLVNGFASQLPTLLSKAGELIITIVQGLTENLPQILSAGMNVISSLVDGISSFLPELIPAAVDMILELAMGLVDNLPQLIDSGIQLLESVVNGIVAALPKIAQKAPEIIAKLATTLIDKAPQLLTTATKLIMKLAVGLVQAIPVILKKIPEIIKAIKDKFLDTDWGKLGKDIMNLVVDGLKSIANVAIDGANWLIDKVNNLPGFDIPHIPYLLHGTDDWQGGFARMNEGGRGELTYLPNGTQVIPHDISVKYAKEAARNNGSVDDYDGTFNAVYSAVKAAGNGADKDIYITVPVYYDAQKVDEQQYKYNQRQLVRSNGMR